MKWNRAVLKIEFLMLIIPILTHLNSFGLLQFEKTLKKHFPFIGGQRELSLSDCWGAGWLGPSTGREEKIILLQYKAEQSTVSAVDSPQPFSARSSGFWLVCRSSSRQGWIITRSRTRSCIYTIHSTPYTIHGDYVKVMQWTRTIEYHHVYVTRPKHFKWNYHYCRESRTYVDMEFIVRQSD